MGLDDKTLKTMNTLANGFARERVGTSSEILEHAYAQDEAGNDHELFRKEIGKLLATAYSKGYADCYEYIGPRKLIF